MKRFITFLIIIGLPFFALAGDYISTPPTPKASISVLGGVAGPGSSTDNAIMRWDGTGGDTAQNSSATVDDSGNLALSNAAGPELLNEAASGTNPTILPNKVNDDTGFGSNADAEVDVIADGYLVAKFREDSNLLFEPQQAINYETVLTANESFKGETLEIDVDDASTVFGNVLYIAADFNADRADADSASTGPAVFLALKAGSGSGLLVLREGQVCDTDWNWSAGYVYLSTTTGELTQTAPSGAGDQVQILGYALSADTIYFDPQLVVVEIAS